MDKDRFEVPDCWEQIAWATDQILQIHPAGNGSWVLRQSLKRHFEAPFLYLLKGSRGALLLDTGATSDLPLRHVVDRLVGPEFPLIVAHSHEHGDHVACDAQFNQRPNTRVCGKTVGEVQRFFGMERWPESVAQVNLGDRVLDVLAAPGHAPGHIAVYDRRTGGFFSGDLLYPGRLYINDLQASTESVRRLRHFFYSNRLSGIYGAHVEMARKSRTEFPLKAREHPEEHTLRLDPEQLFLLHHRLTRFRPKKVGDRWETDHFVMVYGYPG